MNLGAAGAACAAVGVAFAVAAAGSAVIARSGPVDAPGRRSSHARSTPTSGGVALLAAVSAGLLTGVLLSGGLSGLAPVGLALVFATGAGLIGAVDDITDLDARAKLIFSVILALGFAALAGPVTRLPGWGGAGLALWPVLGLIGGGLWIVTVSNAVNFMDGANGLAPGAMAVGFAALAVTAFGHGATGIGVAAACAAAACAGLLPLNLRGRLFQGDAGALFAAFFFAALCLVAAGPDARGPVDLYFGPVVLMPFLADVLLTLLSRAIRGRPLLSAHREHLYQRWLLQSGRSHGALAWRAALIMTAFGILAAGASFVGEVGQTACLLLAAGVCIFAWRRTGRGLNAPA